MAAYVTGILALLLLLYLNLLVKDRVFYPPVLFTLIWLLILCLHALNQLFGMELDMLKAKTIFFIVGMVFTFSLGSFAVFNAASSMSESGGRAVLAPEYRVDRLFLQGFNILAVFATIFFIRKAIHITSAYELGPFIKELRVVLNYQNESFGILKYFVVLVNMNLFVRILLVRKVKQHPAGIIIAFLSALVIAVLNTGRTYIFFVLIFVFTAWLFKQTISFKRMIMIAAVLVFFFAMMGFLTEKGASMSADRQSNTSSMVQSFSEYLLGPVGAFQQLLEKDDERSHGRYTFRFFHKLLHELELSRSEPVDLVRPYVSVPFKTNVYTVFGPYYRDFGVLGTGLFMLLLGGLYGWLYFKAGSERLIDLFFLFLFMNPLALSFFQDTYFSLFSTWLQYLVAALFIFGLFVYRYKE